MKISGNLNFIYPLLEFDFILRLNAFVRWAHSQESLTGIFISDRSGNELIESGADPVIVNSGIELAKPFFNEIAHIPMWA